MAQILPHCERPEAAAGPRPARPHKSKNNRQLEAEVGAQHVGELSSSMPELILAEHRGDVSHVILDRLETRNALNAELVLALGEALRGLG
jgi:hypothetical protein